MILGLLLTIGYIIGMWAMFGFMAWQFPLKRYCDDYAFHVVAAALWPAGVVVLLVIYYPFTIILGTINRGDEPWLP